MFYVTVFFFTESKLGGSESVWSFGHFHTLKTAERHNAALINLFHNLHDICTLLPPTLAKYKYHFSTALRLFVCSTTTVKVFTAVKWFNYVLQQSKCCGECVNSVWLQCVCVCLPLGAALDFPLAGGERVRQSGRRHRWLEPATPALTEQWVQHCYGVSKPQVVPVSVLYADSNMRSHQPAAVLLIVCLKNRIKHCSFSYLVSFSAGRWWSSSINFKQKSTNMKFLSIISR